MVAKSFKRIAALISSIVAVACIHESRAQGYTDEAQSLKQARALLKKMTTQEKIGQLNLLGGSALPGRRRFTDENIVKGEVGAVLWLADPQEIDRLQRIAVEKSRLHIPILFGLDVVHGFETMFPTPLAMASSWDPTVMEEAQDFAAREARASGIRWTYAPMVDIARDARWGRINEGAGEDPYLGSVMAAAQIKGFQGASLGGNGLVACAKHFAGYGAADGGRDYDSAYIPEVTLRNVYLKPFKASIDAGAVCLMSAYMDLNDVPASGNRWLLTEVLRREWGYNGFITSDESAIKNLVVHGFARDPADAALKAIDAGAGYDMAGQTLIQHLPRLVEQGKVTMAQLDAAVLPILRVKYQIGLFDRSRSGFSAVPSYTEGAMLARRVAARSMVLLKNDNNTLPLKRDLKRITVIGPLADSAFDTQGGPSAAGAFGKKDKYAPVTVLAAMKAQFGPSAQIDYVPGPALTRDYPTTYEMAVGYPPAERPTAAQIEEWLKRAKAAASASDVVIAVLGETRFMTGEEGSRATLDLPGAQQRMLEAAASAGKPVVLVLMNGRPLDIRWAADHVPAIVEAWFPGVEGGNAVVDILLGKVNPGGKLPVSWPRSVGQEPLFYNHNVTHHPEDAPGFRSRYWDMASSPLYRFGYGLSYTTFSYGNIKLDKTSLRPGEIARVQVDVENTGSVAGDTVGQVYVHQRAGSASRPGRQLAGFKRVTLEPGEKKTLLFDIGREQLEFWSPVTQKWAVEPGLFELWLGDDSSATAKTEISVLKQKIG